MIEDFLNEKCRVYLNVLCKDIPERCVGSEGNRRATRFFEQQLSLFGWDTHSDQFDAIDWKDGGATLTVDGESFNVLVSPYSLGCAVKAEIVSVSNISELQKLNAQNKIIFLHGEIAKEQLMPKEFVFYNPQEHQKIISLLEKSGAVALVCATGRNAALAGGVYPFPLIEDGDFDIPSVYMTEQEGERLIPFMGKQVSLKSVSERIPSRGFNVTGTKGSGASERIVVTAHIDAKKGTPGAIDNGTGVVILLLLAELLRDYDGDRQVEIVAFNGEDYYAVPGQMSYIAANQGKFENIVLNINIDGAGYREGLSAFSFFDLPSGIKKEADKVLEQYPGITEGIQWPQGDHSIFVQFGRPAIAVSSKWFIENMEVQQITHTSKDTPEIVDYKKVVELANAINTFIRTL